MKTKLFFCISLGLILQFVQAETSISDSKIQKVTAYRNGAFISRVGEVSIPAGSGTLILVGYSDRIDPSTARVHSTGNFDILSVRHKYDYTVPQKQSEEATALDAEREMLLKKQSELILNKEVLKEELDMLNSDKIITKQSKALTIREMTSLMDFFRSRLRNIKLSNLENEENLIDIKKQLIALSTLSVNWII